MRKKELVNYVKTQNKKLSNRKIGLLDIIFKDPFVNELDSDSVFEKINQLLPDHILKLVDIIYIGDFDYFKKRDINAMYSDGAIYVSYDQDNEEDLLDDIIHEYAHAVEGGFGEIIYSDGMIEQNFLSKREKLNKFLEVEGHNADQYGIDEPDYNEELDAFLKDKVGYKKIY